MSVKSRTRKFGKLATLAVAAAALGGVALPIGPANAQVYLGWDFGNGWGVGIGTPPSAYAQCPNYGFPGYYSCSMPWPFR